MSAARRYALTHSASLPRDDHGIQPPSNSQPRRMIASALPLSRRYVAATRKPVSFAPFTVACNCARAVACPEAEFASTKLPNASGTDSTNVVLFASVCIEPALTTSPHTLDMNAEGDEMSPNCTRYFASRPNHVSSELNCERFP